MSSDIFFNDDRIWNARSTAYAELLERALNYCDEDDHLLSDVFCFRREMACLAILDYKDPAIQRKLLTCLRSAALEWLEDIRLERAEDRGASVILAELIGFVDESLAELDAR